GECRSILRCAKSSQSAGGVAYLFVRRPRLWNGEERKDVRSMADGSGGLAQRSGAGLGAVGATALQATTCAFTPILLTFKRSTIGNSGFNSSEHSSRRPINVFKFHTQFQIA